MTEQKAGSWYVLLDGQPVELQREVLTSEDVADEYARLIALSHPESRVQLRDSNGLVREYGPLAAKPEA